MSLIGGFTFSASTDFHRNPSSVNNLRIIVSLRRVCVCVCFEVAFKEVLPGRWRGPK